MLGFFGRGPFASSFASSFAYGVLACALPLFAASGASGCSAPPGEDDSMVASPIINGTASDASQNFVVLLYDAVDSFECTGTLIAPSLVLTARHCLSRLSSDALSCDEQGNPVQGGQLGSDYAPSQLAIYVGATRTKPFPPATAHGAKIVHDGATNLCNHDLAVLELDTPITSVPSAVLRLDAAPTTQDKVTIVGWGVTNAATITPIRMQRTGVAVEAVGPAVSNGAVVPPHNFLVGESICDGDSGSPAFAEISGAVIGVASYGTNGTTPTAGDPAAACTNNGAGVINTFTSLAPFKAVLEQAFADTGARPNVDDRVPPPPPPAPVKRGCACDVVGARAASGSGAFVLAACAIVALRRRYRASA